MGLRGVSPGNLVLRVDIAEIIRNVVNWIPILRGGFGFGGSSFNGADGARTGRQDRGPSACSLGCDSVRTRCRKSHAICFIRLFSMGRLFLFFHSVVQITRSTVVARNRRLHWFWHANQIQHAGLCARRCCRRAFYTSSRPSSKQMAMAWCRTLAVHFLAQLGVASSKRFHFTRFSPAHPSTRCAYWSGEEFFARSTRAHALHVASSDGWFGLLFCIQNGTTFSGGWMFVRDSADYFSGCERSRLLSRSGVRGFVCRRSGLWR